MRFLLTAFYYVKMQNYYLHPQSIRNDLYIIICYIFKRCGAKFNNVYLYTDLPVNLEVVRNLKRVIGKTEDILSLISGENVVEACFLLSRLYDIDNSQEYLKYLAKECTTSEDLFFYYTGHCKINKMTKEQYLVIPKSPKNYVSRKQFLHCFSSCSSKRIMFIFDACYCERFVPLKYKHTKNNSILTNLSIKLFEDREVICITSSKNNEKSTFYKSENKKICSLFTKYFIVMSITTPVTINYTLNNLQHKIDTYLQNAYKNGNTEIVDQTITIYSSQVCSKFDPLFV